MCCGNERRPMDVVLHAEDTVSSEPTEPKVQIQIHKRYVY